MILVNIVSAGTSLVGAMLMYYLGGKIEGMLPVLLSFPRNVYLSGVF